MDLETTIKNIRNLYQTLSAKDADVTLTYKGNNYGITKGWHAHVGDREADHESHEGSLIKLLDMLKKELDVKVKFTENEASRLRKVQSTLSGPS